VGELVLRRSRWGAPAGCVLSLLVHGSGVALVLALAHPTMISAPLEVAAITLVADEPSASEGQPAVPAPPGPEPDAPPCPPRPPPRTRSRRGGRAAPELPAAPVEPPRLETPVPPPPPPAIPAPAITAPAAPASVEPAVARALRIYDSFPTLPDRVLARDAISTYRSASRRRDRSATP
jgi:hypothetical protein